MDLDRLTDRVWVCVECLMSVVNDLNGGRWVSSSIQPGHEGIPTDRIYPGWFFIQWVSCFENVTAILFLVALSGYDECLVEDKDSVSCRNGGDKRTNYSGS